MMLDYVIAADLAYLSGNLDTPVNVFPLAGMNAEVSGAFTGDSGDESQPAFVYAPASTPAHYLPVSFDDWYYRIHFVPAAFDFGNLSGTQQRDMVLWNGFMVPVSLEAFSIADGEGVAVESAVAVPSTLPALEAIPYTITVDAEGPAAVGAVASWTIDGTTYDIPIIGRRTTLFSFPPNWRTQFRETLEWLTTVSTSYDGTEQRAKIRQWPRRMFEYQMRIHNDVARLFDEMTFGWTGRLFSLPMWHEKAKLVADAFPDTTTLYLDTTGVSFVAGGNAILFFNSLFSEPLEIAEVFPDRITLSNSLVGTWPRGSAVFPVMASIPPENFSTSRKTSTHIDVSARFMASPVDAVLRLPVVSADTTYRGEEMYLRSTNWQQAMNITVESRRIDVDNKMGPARIKPKADFPLVVRSMRWMTKTRSEAEDLRAFFVRRSGRQVPAWIPSGTKDFILIDAIGAAQTSFLVKRSEYSSFIKLHAARRDIVIIMKDGTAYPRRLVSVEQLGDNTVLQVDSTFPVVIEPADVRFISYLGLYRLGSDSVTFGWHTDRVCEIDVQFVLTKPWEGA